MVKITRRKAAAMAPPATLTESAGYAAGTLLMLVRQITSLRHGIILGMSAVLIWKGFAAESPLEVARWLALYVAVSGALISSAVFSGKTR